MSVTTDLISASAAAVSAIATCITAAGIWYARRQLQSSREIAQLQFEDALAKEYRDLANRLPTKILLGEPLSTEEYSIAFDELFRYMDLSSEQVTLRQRGRISADTWCNWCEGIQANLALPTFNQAWSEIKLRSNSFKELRRLEAEEFKIDPKAWNEI